jgi:hypothetical protein
VFSVLRTKPACSISKPPWRNCAVRISILRMTSLTAFVSGSRASKAIHECRTILFFEVDMNRRFEIEARPATLGGGWRLRLLQEEPDGSETEMGGGVFRPEPEQGISADDAYADALQTGEDWLAAFAESEA